MTNPMDMSVVEADITTLEVDAIANAANSELWMGSGVAGAIKRAGGDEIEREAMAKGPIAVGDAVATGGGRLSARWVIHGAAMGPDLRTDEELVRRTTRSCLRVADGLGARTLALPAFGTGVGGLPLDVCARAMVDVVTAYEPHTLEEVAIAVRGAEALEAFELAMAQ
jgi:O-acetyl-ADP-ribose deacetylase